MQESRTEQVKIFEAFSKEKEINNWLAENPGIQITARLLCENALVIFYKPPFTN